MPPTAAEVATTNLRQSQMVHQVVSTIKTEEVDDVEKHLTRWIVFLGMGDHCDALGQDTGAVRLDGYLHGGKFCGLNVLPCRALVPIKDTPVIAFGGDVPGAYDTEKPFQAKQPDNVPLLRCARECANDILSYTTHLGGVELVALRGKTEAQAQAIFRAVLPYDYSPYVNISWTREGLPEGGEPNPDGTLVALMEFLKTKSKDSILKARGGDSNPTFRSEADKVREAMVLASNRAFVHESDVYNQCDADMQTRRQTGRGKRGPDDRDLRFARDLELPAPDMKQVTEMAAYGDQVGEQTALAITQMGEMLATRAPAMPPEVVEMLQGFQTLTQALSAQNAFLIDFVKRTSPPPETDAK